MIHWYLVPIIFFCPPNLESLSYTLSKLPSNYVDLSPSQKYEVPTHVDLGHTWWSLIFAARSYSM